MRKIKVFKEVMKRYSHSREKEYRYTGILLQFGLLNGSTSAIVERASGEIENIPLNLVKFVYKD